MKKLNIDRLLALLCAIMVLAAVLPWMSMSVTWGDDQAAYISDGIALAEGSYDEKIRLNSLLHPSPLIEGDMSDTRVYVWGYPLMQSVVYSLVGFDRVDYHTVPFYQLPGIICLSLLAALLYLWFRRCISAGPAMLLAVFFCTNNQLLQNVRVMYSDVPFLLFAVLCFMLSEKHIERINENRGSLPLAVGFGLVLWYCSEIRVNGIAVLAVLAFAQLFCCRKTLKNRRALILSLLPFVIALGLKLVFESFILYPSTSDVGETVQGDMGLILQNLLLYWDNLLLWLVDFPLIPGGSLLPAVKLMLAAFLLLCVLGAALSIKEKPHWILLILGTFGILVNLRYDQGVRYFFPVLPLLLQLAVKALVWLWEKVLPRIKFRPGKKMRAAMNAALLALCLLAAVQTVSVGLHIKRAEPLGAYSPDAVDMYTYIQENTAEDSCIAFMKPRFLYLNTLRPAFVPMINGHDISLADFYLRDSYYSTVEYEQLLALGTELEEVYSNPTLTLYKVN